MFGAVATVHQETGRTRIELKETEAEWLWR